MTDNSAMGQALGGKLGGKIAALVAQSHLAAKGQSADVQARIGALILQRFFEGTGAELRNTMGPVFAMLAEHPDIDPDAKALFGFLARGKGEMASFIGGTITSSVISGGIGDLATNALAPTVHAIIGTQPHAELSVADVAQAKARGIFIGRDHEDEAARAGFNADRFHALVEMSYRRPDVGQIWDAVNRGEISEDAGRGALLQLGFRSGDVDTLMAMRRILIDPARLADLVTFGVLSEDDATPMAERTGMTAADFHMLVLGNGTPPSNEDLAFALRRGIIDRDRYIRGLTQSSLRNEWIPFVEKMVLQPMSVADAVEAVVQSVLPDAEGQHIATQNGLIPEHWAPLVELNGNPPSVQQSIALWHRGFFTRAQLEQAIRESRTKNKYVQDMISLSETLPPERTITSLVAKGALTADRGMALLLNRGYAPDIAQALLDSAHTTKTTKQRELTASQVTTLYADRAVTRDKAVAMLTDLAYDADVIDWELSLADLARRRKFVEAAISKVRALYVSFRMDENAATTTLDSLGVAPDQRDDLLTIWGLERESAPRPLTLAQIEAAYKKKVIDAGGLHDRLRGLGYTEDDTQLIMDTLGAVPGQ